MTLVTGGARCGKSAFAERLAAAGRGRIVYVATARGDDDEMRARIAEHRRRRPADWRTVEAPVDVAGTLAALPTGVGTVLFEDLGLLVSNLLLALTGGREPTPDTVERLDAAVADELDALDERRAAGGWDLIVVTNEVGWGIVPLSAVARIFRDALGRANQALAARADAVYLLVAGIPLRIKPDP